MSGREGLDLTPDSSAATLLQMIVFMQCFEDCDTKQQLKQLVPIKKGERKGEETGKVNGPFLVSVFVARLN